MKLKNKLPQTNEQWLQEIKVAYQDAKEVIPFQHQANTKITENDLFHLAPQICLKFRKIKETKKTIKKAKDAALSSYVANKDQNPALTNTYMSFAFCYVLSHYGLDLINETDAEDLLHYIENNLDVIKTTTAAITL